MKPVSLPVVNPTTIRPSKSGRKRAIVLILVHVVIAVHIGLWLAIGTTMTPLEPSESMEFSKQGIINAGLIFFALTIVSTLFLGRWFCGWACHLVALQDLCRWLLGKVKLRPKPARVGILGAVPLVAFMYMFIAPLVFRVLHGESLALHEKNIHLTTETFWATFPSWIPAILTFLVCGFLIIYLMGSKGFCAYGCPYGAIYGMADQLALGSIRVTDACRGCGHCTAVCSSNVRVHQEVRDYGMVVDPGCMKCLDCVSVCPNDALYFGIGRPSMLAGRRAGGAALAARARRIGATLPDWLLLAGFILGSLLLFMAYDGPLHWPTVWVLAGGTFAAAALFRGRAERRRDYTLAESVVMAAVFLLAVAAFRGLYGMVPFLFALGLGAILSYLSLLALRLLYRRDLGLHGWSLKRAGRLRPAGAVLAACMLAVAALGTHSGMVQYHQLAGRRAYRQAAAAPESGAVDDAIRHIRRAARLSLVPNPYNEVLIGRLHLLGGEPDEYEARLRAAIETIDDDPKLTLELADFCLSRDRAEEAVELYRRVADAEPKHVESRLSLGRTLAGLGRLDEARQAFDEALEIAPDRAALRFNYGVLESMAGRPAEAIAQYEQALELEPDFVEARENLAGIYCQVGRYAEGIEQFNAALSAKPDDPGTHELVARAHLAINELDKAVEHLRTALDLDPDRPLTRALLTQVEAATAPQVSVEREVMDNILGVAVGDATLAAFGFPEPFVARQADRIIRSSYRQRYRQVTPGEGERAVAPPPAPGTASDLVRVVAADLPEQVLAYRRSFTETRPGLRGFKAPVLDDATRPWPIDPPAAESDTAEAARVVAERLAADGLAATTARVVEILGPQRVMQAGPDLLAATGLPVDLLDYFSLPGASPGAMAFAWAVGRRLAEGATAADLADELRAAPMIFEQTRPGFEVVAEDGLDPIASVRLQITRGNYWRGPGAGGCLDVARQLVAALPDADFIASIEDRHLEEFRALVGHWPLERPGRLTLVAEPLVVAQWAQDNGKAGSLPSGEGRRAVTVVPRYASRGEVGSVFVPGESFAADGVAAAGHEVFQTPLIFQGGNLMAVRDPVRDERVLLIGEAEVYRNTPLGLTEAQVLEAFRIELGVDRCVVLPSVSFHIDYDVTLRVHDGRVLAFVNDTEAAVRIVLGLGVDALESGGALDPGSARTARGHLAAGRDDQLVKLLYPVLEANTDAAGRLPLALAEPFAAGPLDSPIANLQRFIAALDALAGWVISPDELPPDRHSRSYFQSFRRRAADRRALHDLLAEQGWTLVPVPGLADAEVSLSTVNGVHAPGLCLMPAYGGFYAPLDDAAAEAYRAVLGDEVEVVPVLCAESQRRVGAVHCSVSAQRSSSAR